MVAKKAFMKTIEILLVIILTMIFLFTIMPLQSSKVPEIKKSYLINLEEEDSFREMASSTSSCFNSGTAADTYIRKYLDDTYDYVLCFGAKSDSLPSKEVFIDTIYFAGNMTETQEKTIRLYYWNK